MATTDTEKQILRRKTGDSLTSFPDEDVDLLFADAEDEYSAYTRKVQLQAVVVRRIDELWTAAMRQVTYQQNETRENLSDIAKNLKAKLDDERKKLDEMIENSKPVALRTAVMKKIPTRIKGYPNG
jgi:hypothetical protein